MDGVESSTIATELASRGIGARSGHMYSPRLMQRAWPDAWRHRARVAGPLQLTGRDRAVCGGARRRRGRRQVSVDISPAERRLVIDERLKGLCTMSSLSPDQFRSRFPIFGRRIYVNSCSQGALSLDVEAAIHEFTASWHEGGSPWEMWVEKVEELRGVFAASIGADRDEIAVMPSASAGHQRRGQRSRLSRRTLWRHDGRVRVPDDGAGVAGAAAPRGGDAVGACRGSIGWMWTPMPQ